MALTHLFVYGTLLPGEVRWHHLQPYVVDEGFDDTAPGGLYDTGQGYPAAVFSASGTVRGRTMPLLTTSVSEAIRHLDEVEGAVRGLYRRVQVTTAAGLSAWAYEYGGGLELARIESGCWLTHGRR
jgi:gamma-glutamylcyclotransferase (GGCT)/AIG2-like uncharacterized protein YtfP